MSQTMDHTTERLFRLALNPRNTNHQNHLLTAYTSLLHDLFPKSENYVIGPQPFPTVANPPCNSTPYLLVTKLISQPLHDSTDWQDTLLPIFLLHAHPPSHFHSSLHRESADAQMRTLFRSDMVQEAAGRTGGFEGVCCMGGKVCFYSFDAGTRVLVPVEVGERGFGQVRECPPRGWWEWDLLEGEGWEKFWGVVEGVKREVGVLYG
ncbi:hypothetical protein HDV00_006632 [Rhizophlyctis rosea]|nr:hypothetical protein HDV00_006632 [Rhizophlyctis rosea]